MATRTFNVLCTYPLVRWLDEKTYTLRSIIVDRLVSLTITQYLTLIHTFNGSVSTVSKLRFLPQGMLLGIKLEEYLSKVNHRAQE